MIISIPLLKSLASRPYCKTTDHDDDLKVDDLIERNTPLFYGEPVDKTEAIGSVEIT
jgi:hypothetical protein